MNPDLRIWITEILVFLGYIVLPHYILARTKTKRRIFKKIKEKVGDGIPLL